MNPSIDFDELYIDQWECYQLPQDISKLESLSSLSKWMEQQKQTNLITKTKLLIAPGYTWRIVTTLVTNFHQPQSTLLLLVAAAAGEDWKKIYEYALNNNFRFLSYGDGCLVFVE